MADDKKANVKDGKASFEVATTLGPVNVDVDATNRPDLTASDAEAEALLIAHEHVGGRALSAKAASGASKSGDSDGDSDGDS